MDKELGALINLTIIIICLGIGLIGLCIGAYKQLIQGNFDLPMTLLSGMLVIFALEYYTARRVDEIKDVLTEELP